MNISGLIIIICMCLSSSAIICYFSSSITFGYLQYNKNNAGTYNLNDMLGNPTCELMAGTRIIDAPSTKAPSNINSINLCRDWCISQNSIACSYTQISKEISDCKSYTGNYATLVIDNANNKTMSGFCRKNTKNRCTLDNNQKCENDLIPSNKNSITYATVGNPILSLANSNFDMSKAMTKQKCSIFCSANKNINTCQFFDVGDKKTCIAYFDKCKIIQNTQPENTYTGSCK